MCQARTHSRAREGARLTPGRAKYIIFPASDSPVIPMTIMTSRRIISTDKDLFNSSERAGAPSISEKSNITPAVPP